VDLLHFFRWLGSLSVANKINDSEWLFPVIESIHISGLAILVGTVAIVDFRLLGLALRNRPVSQIAADLRLWTLAGIDIAAEAVIAEVNKAAKPVTTKEEWAKVASISVGAQMARQVDAAEMAPARKYLGQCPACGDHLYVATCPRCADYASRPTEWVLGADGTWEAL